MTVEQTITDDTSEDIVADIESTTTDTADESAVQSTEEQTENQDEETGSDDTASDQLQPDDEDLAYWKSKGIDTSSPEALKQAAIVARKAEGEFTKQRQIEKQQLKQSIEEQEQAQLAQTNGQISDIDILNMRQQKMENARNLDAFIAKTQATPEEQDRMVKFLSSDRVLPNGNVVKGFDLYANGIVTLEDIYRLTGGGTIDPRAIQEEARKQALEEAANKQRAQRLAGGSTNSKDFGKPDEYDPVAEALAEID